MMRLEAFGLEYCPARLLYREDAAKWLLELPYPKVLFGESGVGKTATVRWLDRERKMLYIEGKNTLITTLQSALRINENDVHRLLELAQKRSIPVVFDDVQRWAGKKDRFNDWLFYIAEAFKELPFVLVTNMERKDFDAKLYDENKRRLYRQPGAVRRLPPYDAEQLRSIITSRVEEAGCSDMVTGAAVGLLAAEARANSYTLSRIFGVLQHWLSNNVRVTEDVVRKQFESAAVEDWKMQLLGMEKHRALFLAAVAEVQVERGKKNTLDTYTEVSVGEAYAKYSAFAAKAGVYTKRLAFMSLVVDELAFEGLLHSSEPQPLSGRGRTSYIKLTNPNPEVVVQAAEVLLE
jgi:Cdc6-like AAA superfamily ATPase